LPEKDLKLKDVIVLYDRDLGVSFFQNFRGYNDLADDAEWLLERTPQKSRGFIIRPIHKNKNNGIWIGEYDYRGNQVGRQNLLFDHEASAVSMLIENYSRHKVSEKRFEEKLAIEELKKKLNSEIIKDFKFFTCPSNRFFHSCTHVDSVYQELTRKFGLGKKVPYSLVANEIEKTKPCEDVVVCPLTVPNLFERILNLSKALKARKLGDIKFTTLDMVEIT
jgi:O6-methylguanine-DNA--protein-cysteine methyltransferase